MIELRLEVFNELFIQHGSGKSNGNHSAQSPADVQAGRNFRSCEKGHSWLIPENAVWTDSGEKKKPMPIGISDFKTATTSYYYVDKTLLIRDFLDTKPMVSLFTRPRRFGKTLNMDMVRVFFEKHRRTPPFISRISRYGSVVLVIPGIRESIRSYS